MEEKKRRILWSPIPGRDEEFFRRLDSVRDEEAFALLLAEAHQKGWIHIFGVTDKDTRDIVAILQEHFKVRYIRHGEGNDDTGRTDNG